MFSTFAKDSWAGHARVSFTTCSFFLIRTKCMRLKKNTFKIREPFMVFFLKFGDGDGSNLCRVKPFVEFQ